jgi:hypothetical protein
MRVPTWDGPRYEAMERPRAHVLMSDHGDPVLRVPFWQTVDVDLGYRLVWSKGSERVRTEEGRMDSRRRRFDGPVVGFHVGWLSFPVPPEVRRGEGVFVATLQRDGAESVAFRGARWDDEPRDRRAAV